MREKNSIKTTLLVLIIISLLLKVFLIFKYKNLLTLSSDDLNYIKTAIVLIEKGIFTHFSVNEPSVFVMPLYPFFLALIFKVLGYGLLGLQAVRVIQAVFSCVTIIYVFLIAKALFNSKIALLAAFFVSVYIPNITTSGYLLTETLFTMLLYVLIYYSIKYAKDPKVINFIILAVIWSAATLCRPTIAFYPALFFLYLFIHHKYKITIMLKYGLIMIMVFSAIFAPWWVRNFLEFGEFIPLSASSGNPMLQGTYVDYKKTPQNTILYGIGKNTYETNKIEVEVAKKRISDELKKDFWGYLRWYTVGKTYYLWMGVFYWKEYFNIKSESVLLFHKIMLLGFGGMLLALFKSISKYMLPILIVIYFNVVHCVYMSFDRYAFPLMPILSIFCAFLLFNALEILKGIRRSSISNP